jgi:hypothetical protein
LEEQFVQIVDAQIQRGLLRPVAEVFRVGGKMRKNRGAGCVRPVG